MTRPVPLMGGQPTLFERISAESLRALLWEFYRRVCQDEQLGPVFEGKIGPFPGAGWPMHIARIDGFWRSVTHGPSAYRGQPGRAHMNLGIQPQHFDRWLAIWAQTLPEFMGETESASLLNMAQRMRPTLERFAVEGKPPAGPKYLPRSPKEF